MDGFFSELVGRGAQLVDSSLIAPSSGMARATIKQADFFISYFGKLSATIGKFSNQLSSAVDALTVTNENYAASKSRIMDVDVAKESANLTRNQILQQASASLLTQTNQQPQIALSLIR